MKKMKKTASKVAEPAQNLPKSQFLFHKDLSPRDFSIMTLFRMEDRKKESPKSKHRHMLSMGKVLSARYLDVFEYDVL